MTAPRFDDYSPYDGLPVEHINGYARATVKNHPLADARGRVRLHRAVLFDAIGPGPHACRWCGFDGLRWDVSQQADEFLVVDHVDGDSGNNLVSNLVASCSWCNNNRAVAEGLGIDLAEFADVPPSKRPALRRRTGEPTAAALALVAGPVELAEEPVIVAASPRAEVKPTASKPYTGMVRWCDVVGPDGELMPFPDELVAMYPDLLAKYGRSS